MARDYAAALRQRRPQPSRMHELAIAWRGKDVRVAPARGTAPARTAASCRR